MKRFSLLFVILFLSFLGAGRAGAEDLDQPYAAKIRECTSEKFFLTELVDHLPRAKGVPTPLEYLGHIVGAPDILDYSRDIHGYMRALAKASPRVQVFTMGPTDQGKEMILVAVSSEANMARLGEIRESLRRLADPRLLAHIPPDGLLPELLGTIQRLNQEALAARSGSLALPPAHPPR